MDVPQILCMMRQQGQPLYPPGRAAFILHTAKPTRGELNHSSCLNLRLLLPITDLLPCFFQRGSRSGLSATSDAVLCAARALCLQHVSRKQLRKLGRGAGQPWDPEPSPARASPASGQRVLAAKAALSGAAVVCSLGHPDDIGGWQETRVHATAVGVAGICKTEKTTPHI